MRNLSLIVVLGSALGCSQLPRDADLQSWMQANMGVTQANPAAPTPRRRDGTKPAAAVIARQAEARGDVATAMKAYSRWIQESPELAAPRHRLAVLHDKQGDHAASAPLYKEALALAPQDAVLLTDYAYSRYIQGDLAVAEQTLRSAIEADPHFARAHNNLALVLSRQGKDEAAIAAFEKGGLTHEQARENLAQSRLVVSDEADAGEHENIVKTSSGPVVR